MRILGGVAILLAVVLLAIAVGCGLEVLHMHQQVDEFSDLEDWANDLTGQSRKNAATIQSAQIATAMFAIGAVLLGGLGAVFIGASFLPSKSHPVNAEIVSQQSRLG